VTAAVTGVIGAMLGVAALTLYSMTLTPTVAAVDSGELTLAASVLGVPHPPGFPLFVLVSHAFTLVPIGSIAERVNFASALFAAFAVTASFALACAVLAAASNPSTPPRVGQPAGHAVLGGALTAAMLFATSRTLWAYATVAEVYTLAICLVLLIWKLMTEPTIGRMRLAAVLFGLALGTHPAIVLPVLPAFAWLVWRRHGLDFFRSRRFGELFVLASIAVALAYAYLPLAAARAPILNWGDPQTAERFWEHVSGWQYRGEAVALTGGAVVAAARRLGVILWQQVGAPLLVLPLVLMGLGRMWRTRSTLLAALVIWAATNVLLVVPMNARWAGDQPSRFTPIDDLDAYYLPALVVLSTLAGAGVTALLCVTSARFVRLVTVAAVVIASVLASVWRYGPINDRRGDLVSRNYADEILRSIENGGLLLLRDWSLSSPLMYVQHAEHQRPDVVALDLNLMERHWYVSTQLQRHPAVFTPALAELAAYLQLVRRWQEDPGSLQRDPAYHATLAETFDTLLIRLAEHHMRKAPVFVTYEVATAQDGKGQGLAAKLGRRFQLVPNGLVFRLESDRQFREPAIVELRVRQLLDVLRRTGDDHPNAQWIADVYRHMFVSRGLYLEEHARCDQAAEAFRQALAIDPPLAAAAAIRSRCGGSTKRSE
jgi:hypothetical protein